ncbi:MAG: sulfite exporter TauE/SafE family protein [Desulfovibrionaceae bacterium]
MYFPTAGIECSPLLPPLAAFAISLFTSLGGVSGAFLLLPFQMSFLGYVNPSVSATNQFFNVVATPSGVWRYAREGRLVAPLALAVAAGTLPGVFIGAIIRVRWLPDPAAFTVFAAAVLLFIGGRMARDLWRGKRPAPPPLYLPTRTAGGLPAWSLSRPSSAHAAKDARTWTERLRAALRGLTVRAGTQSSPRTAAFPRVRMLSCTLRQVSYEYNGETCSFPIAGVLMLTFIVGIVGGTYGIGGGAIIAPFLVSLFGLPVHTVAGASLLGTFLTSVAAVAFYMLIAPWFPEVSIAPDFLLGLLLGLGGMAGIYCGARLQKHVPARAIKLLLTAILLFTAARYLWKAL